MGNALREKVFTFSRNECSRSPEYALPTVNVKILAIGLGKIVPTFRTDILDVPEQTFLTKRVYFFVLRRLTDHLVNYVKR